LKDMILNALGFFPAVRVNHLVAPGVPRASPPDRRVLTGMV
jgi:hypothetical protein